MMTGQNYTRRANEYDTCTNQCPAGSQKILVKIIFNSLGQREGQLNLSSPSPST
jgi:hypothetical protein